MQNMASTVQEYLAGLPEAQRELVSALRDAVRRGLPQGVEEGMQYGMIGFYVPHSIFPAGYHCDPKQPVPYAGVGAQKHGASLYLFCVYVDPHLAAWFAEAYARTGRRMDMGKGCVRFKRLADVPLDLVTEVVRRVPLESFLATYTAQIPASAKKKR